MSTALVVVAWTIVAAAVTNSVWNRLVPTTTCAPMPKTYSITGTSTNPPPTPSRIVSTPTRKPRINGASGEM